ncbi:MAG: hypothetical protein II132_02795 [Desulfovibrio sp.]|nr:hypothetical protein [Desulfovibrio sp.]
MSPVNAASYVGPARAAELMDALWLAGSPCQANAGGSYDVAAASALKLASWDFAKQATRHGFGARTLFWLREKALDCAVGSFASQYPDGAVVSLRCGLSTAEFRASLGRCAWYNVDEGPVHALRRALFRQAGRGVPVDCPFLDPRWMDRISCGQGQAVLFLADGLFSRMELGLVKAFVALLAVRFPGGRLYFDALAGAAGKVARLAGRIKGSRGVSTFFCVDRASSLKALSPRIAGVSSRLPDLGRSDVYSLGERVCRELAGRVGLVQSFSLDFAGLRHGKAGAGRN